MQLFHDLERDLSYKLAHCLLEIQKIMNKEKRCSFLHWSNKYYVDYFISRSFWFSVGFEHFSFQHKDWMHGIIASDNIFDV